MPSPLKRIAWVLAGAVFGGAVAAGSSALVSAPSWMVVGVANPPNPLPMAVGVAVAVPVMDVGLYPGNVPDDRESTVRIGVLAALSGASAGVLVAMVLLALAPSLANPLSVAAAFLVAEYAGRYARSRSRDASRPN